jgi:hypothetical protein
MPGAEVGQAGKPQCGCTQKNFRRGITSDFAGVNQRLMSPSFGDLADWLCNAF